ncbi:putative partner of vegetative incompatibility protein 6 [Diaporthe ampelina]|uniref:Putative partner of vegetative incompatibility protein 6 n=1 Tax=Diaporthe ampelina TaxID=1214573 RepID=A0A0G2FWK3_9PEZI|nr:putative partner of vegetative incompatibility protein 6 [Diaporthe ampelina]
MAKKGGGAGENSKKAAGQARKADAAANKKAAEDSKKAAVEDAEWSKGSKKANAKKEDEAAKKAEAARKKAERDALLAEEEKNTPGRSAPKNAKSAQKKTRGLDLDQLDLGEPGDRKLATLNASGLDNALDALDITSTDDKVKIDRHPERRVAAARKAWLEALEEQWENEGVLKEKKKYRGAYNKELIKLWKNAPENPMNQVSADYNATQEELAELRTQEKEKIENRLAEKK